MPEDLAWIHLRKPASESVLRLATDLGPGETAVLALALESRDPVVILDDALARRYADVLGLPLTGTPGVLLDAKRAGFISAKVGPVIDNLDRAERLGFIPSADDWMTMRKRRNQMLQEYIENPLALADALEAGHRYVALAEDVAQKALAEARQVLCSRFASGRER